MSAVTTLNPKPLIFVIIASDYFLRLFFLISTTLLLCV